MASKSAILAVKIIGDADKAIDSLGKTGLAAGAMGAAVVAGGVIAGKALYGIGETFSDVSNSIVVGTGASGEALDGLVDSAKTVGTTVPVDFQDAGDAIASLNTTLGATGKPLEDMTAGVLDASRMLGEDGVANADAFGRAMSQWQRPAEDGADLMDTLFLSTQKYGIGLDAQIGHLNTYGSVLQNAGFSMEEAASLFGQLESGGISVSRVMPGLNKSFRDWASEGKDVQTELGNTVDAIRDAESGTEALGLATDVFGAEGAQRLTTAIRSGKFELDDLAGALDGAAGTVADTSAETMTASESWTLMLNNITAALEPLGSIVFGLVGDAFGALAGWIGGIDFTPIEAFAQTVSDALPGLATGFLSLAEGAAPLPGLLAAMGPAVATIGAAFMDALPTLIEFGQGILPHIATAVGNIIPVLMSVAETVIPAVLGILQTALPIISGIIDAVVPAVVAAIGTLVPVILQVIPPIVSIVQTVLGVLGPAIEWLLPLVTGIFGALVTQITGAIQIITGVLTTVAALLRGDFAGAWEGIKGIVGGAITFVQGIIQQGMAIISAVTGQSVEKVKSTFRDGFALVVSTVKTKAGDLIGEVKALPGKITSALGNLGSLLTQAGKDLIQGMINGIGSMGSALRDKAGNLAGGAVDAIKGKLGIASPSKVLTEIGMQTGEGFINGVDKMQRGAAGAMTDLVEVPEPALIPVALKGTHGGRAGGRETHVHVHIDGAFIGDRMSLAEELERILNDRRTLIGAA